MRAIFFLPLDSMWLSYSISSQPPSLHKFHDISALQAGQEAGHELLTPPDLQLNLILGAGLL